MEILNLDEVQTHRASPPPRLVVGAIESREARAHHACRMSQLSHYFPWSQGYLLQPNDNYILGTKMSMCTLCWVSGLETLIFLFQHVEIIEYDWKPPAVQSSGRTT